MAGLNFLRKIATIPLAIAAGVIVLAITGTALLFTLFCAPPLARLRQG